MLSIAISWVKTFILPLISHELSLFKGSFYRIAKKNTLSTESSKNLSGIR